MEGGASGFLMSANRSEVLYDVDLNTSTSKW